jgi:hypothetical protein
VTTVLCLILAALPPDGLAPLGPGYVGEGARADVVLRSAEGLVSGKRASARLLLSDPITDAPLEARKVSLRLLGPEHGPAMASDAPEGRLPGHYLVEVLPGAPGSDAFVVSVDGDLVAGNGILVSAAVSGSRRRFAWPWPSLLLLAVSLALLRRSPTLAVLLLSLTAASAWAHDMPQLAAPPLGTDVRVAQEIQFALGIRTALPEVQAFDGPVGGAPRRFVSVPRSAVVERDGHKIVFVRVAPERFESREPRFGSEMESGSQVRVAALQGLGLEDKVVVEGAAFLRNGGASP